MAKWCLIENGLVILEKVKKKFIDKWINATIAYGPGELKHFLIPVNSITISFGVVKYEIA